MTTEGRSALGSAGSQLLTALLSPERRYRHVVLVAMVAFFAVLKHGFNPGLGRPCTDGNYYFQIARNVAEGHGFTTSVSLYNQGLRSFPHNINISPLWPLSMGLLGKLFDLQSVALVVPEILFCVVLCLLYVLANRIARRIAEGAQPPPPLFLNGKPLDVGHVAVALFGANAVFFKVTSTPYTEALAFLFLFAALIAVDAAAEQRSSRVAALAGGLAALAFLTRAQMIGVLLAVPFALLVTGIRERRFWVLAGAAAAATAVVVLPWFAWIASWAPSEGWQTFTGLGTLHESTGLNLFRQTVAAPSTADRLSQVREGLVIAFSPRSKDSYVASFGAVVYAVPLAVIAAVGGPSELKRLGRRAASADGCLLLVVAVSAFVMLAPLHTDKRQFFRTWLFAWRHGLPFILPILVALPYLLLGADRLGRALGVLLVAASLIQAFGSMQTLLHRKYAAGPSGPEAELAAWLDQQNPRPAVITTNAQVLSSFSRSYFHWMDCKVPAQHTRTLLENGAADYVLLYPNEASCPYFQSLRNAMTRVKSFKRGWKVELWTPKAIPLGSQPAAAMPAK